MLAICHCLALPRLLSDARHVQCMSLATLDRWRRACHVQRMGGRSTAPVARQAVPNWIRSILAAFEMSLCCVIPVRQSLPTDFKKTV
jgi:hypothetical protein